MENKKLITYTLEIDREKYNTLPVVKALNDPNLKGSAELTADILLPFVTNIKEINLNNVNSWDSGNYKALVSWAGRGEFLGESKLFQQSQGLVEGLEIIVATKIKGIV